MPSPKFGLRRLPATPVFDGDPQQTLLARWLSLLLRWLVLLLLAYLVIVVPLAASNKTATAAGIVPLLLGTAASLILVHLGRLRAASLVLVGVFWASALAFNVLSGGTRNVTMVLFFQTTAMAGLLLGRRWGWGMAAASATATLMVSLVESAGYPLPRVFPFSPLTGWTFSVACLVVTMLTIAQSLAGHEEALAEVRRRLAEVAAAREALAESEGRYRLLAEHSSDVIWLADLPPAEGEAAPDFPARCRYVSPAAERVLGYTPEEILAAPLLQTVAPSSASLVLEAFRAELEAWREAGPGAAPPAGSVEVEFTRRDGTGVWTEVAAALVVDECGRPSGIVGATRDIDRRRRAEEHGRLLASAMEQASEALLVISADLSIAHVNGRLRQETSYSPEEAIGRPFAELFSPADQTAAVEVCAEVLRGGEPWSGVLTVRRRDGSTFPAEGSISPLRNADGRITHLVAVGRDISERLALEQCVRQAQKLEAVGRLAAGVAHEFNNILAGMAMRAELATELDDTDEYRTLAELVTRAAAHGSDICRNLTAFARPTPPRIEPLQVTAPLDHALSMAAQHLRTAEIEVERDYSGTVPGIAADAGQLEQVFLNLLINACHAMPKGGTLRISVDSVESPAGDPWVVVRVADTGHGIAPEQLPRIFEPFFTTKGALGAGEVPGTGLGLSVSHGIVTAHGGTIGVSSRVGEGSEFELRFPASPIDGGAAPETDEVDHVAARPASRHLAILLAEDDPDVREAVTRALETSGHLCVPTDGVAAAIEAMDREHFDVVVTDLLMPGGGGRAVARHAAQRGLPLPVIAITGRNDPGVAQETADMGVRVLLTKPLSLRDLLSSIEALGGAMGRDRGRLRGEPGGP